MLIRAILFLLSLASFNGVFADDGRVIEGAFGLEFDGLDSQALGASADGSPIPAVLYDLAAGRDAAIDSTVFPKVPWLGWHHFSPSSMPPRLKDRAMRFFALTTEAGQLVMVAALLPDQCGELSAFFTGSITRKYELRTTSIPVEGETLAAFSDVQRWSSRGRHIVLACGSMSYLVYADEERISNWREDMRDRARLVSEQRNLALIAETTRLLPGDRHHVRGAFGILFARPVPGHEALDKETTVRWSGVVLPSPYDKATYELVLDPDGYPARIAGSFEGADFEMLKSALEARFGVAGKSTPTHVIHKVSGDFVSLRRQASGARLVVINHDTDEALRARAKTRAEARWERETSGL